MAEEGVKKMSKRKDRNMKRRGSARNHHVVDIAMLNSEELMDEGMKKLGLLGNNDAFDSDINPCNDCDVSCELYDDCYPSEFIDGMYDRIDEIDLDVETAEWEMKRAG